MGSLIGDNGARHQILHYVDWLHFQEIGEIGDITFEWWWSKYRKSASKVAALRGWERHKANLRNLGLPVEFRAVHGKVVIHIPDRASWWLKAAADAFARHPNNAERRRKYEIWRRKYWSVRTDPERQQKRRVYWSGRKRNKEMEAAYAEGNKDKIKARRQRYQRENRAVLNISHKMWRDANRRYVAKMNRDREMAKKDARWKTILQAHGDACSVCGQSFPVAAYDLLMEGEDTSLWQGKGIKYLLLGPEQNFEKALPHLRVICANCNRITKDET